MITEIGEKIKKLRNNAGWSLRELENRTNINYSVLSRIEAGKRPITDSEILIFSKLFSVSPNFLLGFEESKEPQPQSLFTYDQIGVSQKDYENLSPYQQEVLEWAINEDALFFKNKSKNVLEMMERLEIAYEVEKVIQKREKR